MVGNLCEEYIFVFFASQETFAKIKTRKLCQVNELHFNPSYLAANRSMASVPLMAEAIQDIEMLRKCRYPGPDSGTRLRAEAIVSMSIFLATLKHNTEIAISLHHSL